MPRNWKWGKRRASGFRSGLEEKVAGVLDDKEVVYVYEGEKLQYTKNVSRAFCRGCNSTSVAKKATYTPDFTLDNKTIIEVKGRLTATDRAKLVAIKKDNPDRKIVLYFGADNKINKNSETRYSDWATKYGFDFSVNAIPRRWLKQVS